MTRAVRVAADAEALAAMAAGEVARRAIAAVASRGRFDLALAGGSTPRRTYERLAAGLPDAAVPWPRTHIWFGDERMVPPENPDSNYGMAREALLRRVAAPPAQVHRIRGEEPDAEVAARAYEVELRAGFGLGEAPEAVPRFDLVLLGMGLDGHVASLFPGHQPLREQRRLACAAEGPLGGRRVTLTLPVINAAAAVAVLVSGAEKAGRVAQVLLAHAPELPAGRLAPAGELLWLLDAAAAAGWR